MNARLFRARAWPTLIAMAALNGCGTMPQGTPAAPPSGTPAPQVVPPLPQRAPEPPPPAPAPPPPAVPPARALAAKADLNDGIALYDAGDFSAAISKLGNSAEIAAAGPEIQVPALKYLAFSFCVTKRPTQCRTQFESAFKLDPLFDLAPAERGHPLWGPVFDRVKKSQQAAPK